MRKSFLFRALILMILFTHILLSCKQDQQKNRVTTNKNNSSLEIDIAIDTFSKFPPEIYGCACYFSNN